MLTVCDGMNSIARIFNANVGTFPMDSTPMGWDSHYQILAGTTFDTSAAVKGSVASWLAGDFNYNDAGSVCRPTGYRQPRRSSSNSDRQPRYLRGYGWLLQYPCLQSLRSCFFSARYWPWWPCVRLCVHFRCKLTPTPSLPVPGIMEC